MDTYMLASIPAILAVVNLAKLFGIRGKWAALTAVVFGVVFRFIDQFAQWGVTPDLNVFAIGAQGLILGLSAAGLYDVAATITTPKTSSGRGKHSYES